MSLRRGGECIFSLAFRLLPQFFFPPASTILLLPFLLFLSLFHFLFPPSLSRYGAGQSSEPEFVFLSPKGNDPIVDHGLLGPTYSEILEWEGRRYQELCRGREVRWRDGAVRARVAVDEVARWIAVRLLLPIAVKLLAAWSWLQLQWETQPLAVAAVLFLSKGGGTDRDKTERRTREAARSAEVAMVAAYAGITAFLWAHDKIAGAGNGSSSSSSSSSSIATIVTPAKIS